MRFPASKTNYNDNILFPDELPSQQIQQDYSSWSLIPCRKAPKNTFHTIALWLTYPYDAKEQQCTNINLDYLDLKWTSDETEISGHLNRHTEQSLRQNICADNSTKNWSTHTCSKSERKELTTHKPKNMQTRLISQSTTDIDLPTGWSCVHRQSYPSEPFQDSANQQTIWLCFIITIGPLALVRFVSSGCIYTHSFSIKMECILLYASV